MTDAARDGAPAIDWTAIEGMPEFQELATGRRRFAWVAGGIGTSLGALYVVLAATAHDLMATRLAGSFSLGFAGGVGLVLLTWAITLTYMRRSDRVWGPLEARVRERALAISERTVPADRFVYTTDSAVTAGMAPTTVLATEEPTR
jgi:uncharacterized membrane protein (DUF485 family)